MPVKFDFPTLLFLYWVALFMPFMAWVSLRKIKSGSPIAPKTERFRIAVALLIVTGLVAMATADSNAVRVPLQYDSVSMLFAVAIVIGLLSGVVRGRHRQPPEHRERIRMLYAPSSTREYCWAVAGGIAAGIAEEIAYRAVLYELLARRAGYGVSIVVCVLLFVLAHLPQGLRGAMGVGAMAIVFHILYVLSGSLLPGIIVHAAYDVGLFTILLIDERRQAVPATAVEQPAISQLN